MRPKVGALFLSALMCAFASAVAAQDCPDFYRFVDFGTIDDDGNVYRGGTLLRAENFDEERLLLEEETDCLPVWPTLTDGRGNPMPVVSSIFYDPAAVGSGITRLRIHVVEDTTRAAERAAKDHLTQVNIARQEAVRGEAFICAQPSPGNRISCQLVSPYSSIVPLVMYCDETLCEMPVLPIDERL